MKFKVFLAKNMVNIEISLTLPL